MNKGGIFPLSLKLSLRLKDYPDVGTPRNKNGIGLIQIPIYLRRLEIDFKVILPFFSSLANLLYPGFSILRCVPIFQMLIRVGLIELTGKSGYQTRGYTILS